MQDAGVAALLEMWVTGVVREGRALTGVLIDGKGGRQAILARAHVDATGEIIYLDMGGMIRAPVEIWPMTRTAELVEQAYNALLADSLPEMITDPEDP